MTRGPSILHRKALFAASHWQCYNLVNKYSEVFDRTPNAVTEHTLGGCTSPTKKIPRIGPDSKGLRLLNGEAGARNSSNGARLSELLLASWLVSILDSE